MEYTTNWSHNADPAQMMQEADSKTAPFVPNMLWNSKLFRYHPKRQTWKHVPHASSNDEHAERALPRPRDFRLITWNVDFMAPYPQERLAAALEHLASDVLEWDEKRDAPEPTVIALQEVHMRAIHTVLQAKWVQDHFLVTPADVHKWPHAAQYGVLTLVSRDLDVVRAQMLHYAHSQQKRTALAVDVRVCGTARDDASGRVVRVINTHLESLPDGEELRALQLDLCAKWLRDDPDFADDAGGGGGGPRICGGLVAGDMNAIADADKTLPRELGLQDAVHQESERYYTWGYQGGGGGGGGGTRFPPNRLDKILYVASDAYDVEGPPETIGKGVKWGSVWASDHYGLAAMVEFKD